MSEDPAPDEIDGLLAEYLEEAALGRPADPDEFASRAPAFKARLLKRLRALGRLDACLGQLRIGRPDEAVIPPIAGYRVLERLGQGGMGVVFLAEQTALKRLVALKVLSPYWMTDARTVERFRREAETIARLSHPGIVAIHQFGEEGGTLYLSIDFVPGMDLGDLVAKLGRGGAPPSGSEVLGLVQESVDRRAALADKYDARVLVPSRNDSVWSLPYPELCAFIVKGVAEALGFAHTNGVLHRDVKSSNVILSLDGRPRLIDFGLTLTDSASSLTRPTDFVGSAPYCSPEQIEGDSRRFGPASEIFSLGVVLYEMLSLRRPFDGKTLPEIMSKVAKADPPDLRRIAPWVDSRLADICRTAMAKDSRRRYATAEEFARDLQRYLEGCPVHASSARRKSQAARAAATAAAIMLTFGVGVRILSRSGREPALEPARTAGSSRMPTPPVASISKVVEPPYEKKVAAAWAAIEHGDANAALEDARAAVRLSPRRFEGLKVLGYTYMLLERYSEAAFAYGQALEVEPMNLKIRAAYAESLAANGDLAAAERQYALCATQAPKDAAILHGYGGVLARRGDIDGAVRQYKKSLDVSSPDAKTHLILGELLSGLSRTDEAVYYYTKAEKLATTDADRRSAKEGLDRLVR